MHDRRSANFEDFISQYTDHRLPSRQTLAALIPKILEREQDSVRAAVGDDNISLMLDGMTRLGELFVIIIRHVNDNLEMSQKLLSLRTMAKTLNHMQMAGEVFNELTLRLDITGPALSRLVCISHDRAAVNRAAVRHMVCTLAAWNAGGMGMHQYSLHCRGIWSTCLLSAVSLY